MADLVGIRIDPAQTGTVFSASGELEVVYGRVTLEIGRGRGRHRWVATVALADQAWQEAALGHLGFLRYFDASFLGGRREVRLRRNAVPLPKV
jgi:hypothetical protein